MSIDDQIRDLLSQIKQLEQQIARANEAKRAAQQKIQKYTRRRDQVTRVRDSLSGRINNCAGDVASAQRTACDTFDGSTSGFRHEQEVLSSIGIDMEKETESDSRCSQVFQLLNAEIRDCQNQINAANDELRQANNNSSSCQGSRSSLINRARSLQDDPEATIHVV